MVKLLVKVLAVFVVTGLAITAVALAFSAGWSIEPWYSVLVVWAIFVSLAGNVGFVLATVSRLRPSRRDVLLILLGPIAFVVLSINLAIDSLFPR